MLVLSRKVGQRVYIGQDIRITVTGIRGRENKVRIGIEAPRGVPILREELMDSIPETFRKKEIPTNDHQV